LWLRGSLRREEESESQSYAEFAENAASAEEEKRVEQAPPLQSLDGRDADWVGAAA